MNRTLSCNEGELKRLTEWFQSRVSKLPDLEMTEEAYLAGIDAIESPMKDYYKKLVKEGARFCRRVRRHDPSYNQLCKAFFGAMKEAGKLVLIPKHPIFRLGTPVIIKTVEFRDKRVFYEVFGEISFVYGDQHTVIGTVGIGDSRAGEWCVLIHTKDLENELRLRVA